MTKLPKICLWVCLATFAVGLFDVMTPMNLPSIWGAAMPLAAVALGAFFIFHMLEAEMALYDQEVLAR